MNMTFNTAGRNVLLLSRKLVNLHNATVLPSVCIKALKFNITAHKAEDKNLIHLIKLQDL